MAYMDTGTAVYEQAKTEEEKFAAAENSVRLPEAEFDVMQAVWNGEAPMTTNYLMKAIGNARGWKAPTLISFLVRLEKRGFIVSCKKGKERYYTPVAKREDYLSQVTEQFVARYHGGSFVNLLDALYSEKDFSTDEVDALLEWLKRKYH
jgi:predicted transcriptional regulator